MRRRFYFALPRKRYHSESMAAWMQNCREMDRR
jgi:hypothetical protein